MPPQTMTLRLERRAVNQLLANPHNARVHSKEQIRQIAASIREFGFVNPVLIGPDNVLIAGHARVEGARQVGLEDVPVIVLDHLTPAQRRALAIADNALPLGATWDEEILRAELAALDESDFDLALSGFDDEELARLLADEDAVNGLTDEDTVPELPQAPVSRPGDLWVLGQHCVLCGDATVPTDVERLMAGDAADLVFIDPPYNVDYEGYTNQRLKMHGDHMPADQFRRFLEDTFRSCRTAAKPSASLYVWHASSWQQEFQNALEGAGFKIRCQIVTDEY